MTDVRNKLARYLAGIIAVSLAAFFIMILGSILGDIGSYFIAMGAVALVSVSGGYMTGATATLVFGLGINYFVIAPSHEFNFQGRDGITFILFIGTGLIVSTIGGSLRKTFARLESANKMLKQSMDELQRSEWRFRRLVDSNIVGIAATNSDGEIYEANDAFLKMLGFSREEYKQTGLHWKILTPEDQKERDKLATSELFTLGSSTPRERAFFRKDKSKFYAMAGSALLDQAKGTCITVIVDISIQKDAEAAKTKALQAREDLLAVVSHDLKNPLSAVKMNAELLMREGQNIENPRIVKWSANIKRSGDRMNRLITDLLDLEKIAAGRLVVVKADCSAESILNEAIEMIEVILYQKSLRIEKRIIPSDFSFKCDRDRVNQVFSNLVGNAVKFTSPGGIISLTAENLGSELRFSVKDNGIGIAKDEIPFLFDRYYQGKGAIRRDTGLGLSISKGIVEAHGGRIWAESTPGEGSCFYFTIPDHDGNAVEIIPPCARESKEPLFL